MLLFFWGNWAEDHLFKEKGETAKLATAMMARGLLGFTPSSGKILEDRTPPWPRLEGLPLWAGFLCKLDFTSGLLSLKSED